MAAKFTLILCLALFSVALAVPVAQPHQVESKETMKPAETFSFGFGLGHPGLEWHSPFSYRSSIGYNSAIGYGFPYYNHYGSYLDDRHYFSHY